LRWPGPEKTSNGFSLAGFVTRPQAENQIGAAESGWNLTRPVPDCQIGEGVSSERQAVEAKDAFPASR
jgi:hypothetical protein